MVPLKPLTLARVTVEVAVDPGGIVRLLGLAVMVKSRGGGAVTKKFPNNVWDNVPLVPVMVKL